MKKTLISLVICLLSSLSLYSQWGVKLGVNSSKITDYSLGKYMFSGDIGLTYEKNIVGNWYIQPELLFTSIGCNLKDDGSVLKDGHIRVYALELPINASFRPYLSKEVKLLFDFGLYARYGLFGNKTYKYYELPKVDESPFDAINRFDMGFNLGAGVQYRRISGVFTFQRGLTHAEKGSDTNFQVFKFSVGYKF